eukprot:3239309-Pyramimonas_sp.AAC.1
MILAYGGAVVGALGALLGRHLSFLGPLGTISDRLGAVVARAEFILNGLGALSAPPQKPKRSKS